LFVAGFLCYNKRKMSYEIAHRGELKWSTMATYAVLFLIFLFSGYFDILVTRGYFDFFPQDVLDTVGVVTGTIFSLWWLWSFLVIAVIANYVWIAYRVYLFKMNLPFVILELRIPREVRKTPRAMEQVLMSIHSLRNSAGNPKERWWDGEVTFWFSFEVVRHQGEIHFYARVPKGRRNIVEAALYAQYQDIEIVEVEDYIDQVPATPEEIEKKGYNFFGTELRLEKPDEYPIRTFEDFASPAEEKELDPISTLLETLGKLTRDETVWVQILFRPVGDSWRKKGVETIAELKDKFARRKQEIEGGFTFSFPAPGETDLLKMIDKNISKPGFETLIRYIYFAPKAIYSDSFPRRGLLGAFNQYASESLNKFAHNIFSWTRADLWNKPHFFWKRRLKARKKMMMRNYRRRLMLNEMRTTTLLEKNIFYSGFKANKLGRMTLNAEELATVFHLPTNLVLTGPLIKREDARKIGPPAGLQIFGNDEDILPGVKPKKNEEK